MRIAIISDVHGNLEALEAVRNALSLESPDRIFCLGDLVGYGPDPDGCVETVTACSDIVLAGNHDRAAAGLLDMEYFNEYAQIAMTWTRNVITGETGQKLKSLPLIWMEGDMTFVHATPESPEKWDYVLDAHEARYQFVSTHGRIFFIGHTHIPAYFRRDSRGKVGIYKNFYFIELEADSRYIINVGSVGQPRDGDARACYGIYDTEKGAFNLKRCAYDVEAVQKKMRGASLPEYLINRLSLGY